MQSWRRTSRSVRSILGRLAPMLVLTSLMRACKRSTARRGANVAGQAQAGSWRLHWMLESSSSSSGSIGSRAAAAANCPPTHLQLRLIQVGLQALRKGCRKLLDPGIHVGLHAGGAGSARVGGSRVRGGARPALHACARGARARPCWPPQARMQAGRARPCAHPGGAVGVGAGGKLRETGALLLVPTPAYHAPARLTCSCCRKGSNSAGTMGSAPTPQRGRGQEGAERASPLAGRRGACGLPVAQQLRWRWRWLHWCARPPTPSSLSAA